jgi:hypothetical protein
MHRFCGSCGNPLGSDNRCPKCGWTPPPETAPVAAKLRYCGACGRPLGSDAHCHFCGWTAAAVNEPADDGQPAKKKSAKQKRAKSKPAGKKGAARNHDGKKKKKNILPVIIPVAVVVIAILTVVALNLFGVINLFGKKKSVDNIERLSAKEYLSEIGKVTDKTSAKKVELLTEAEAYKEFSKRGFDDISIVAYYDIKGNSIGTQEISSRGKDKHPSYHALYSSPSGVVWNISLAGDIFYAVPLSLNNEGAFDVPYTITEAKYYWVYDGVENAFFTVDLDDDVAVLKRVNKIDADTIDELDAKEIDEL